MNTATFQETSAVATAGAVAVVAASQEVLLFPLT
mgnify:CR=1 FL=1